MDQHLSIDELRTFMDEFDLNAAELARLVGYEGDSYREIDRKTQAVFHWLEGRRKVPRYVNALIAWARAHPDTARQLTRGELRYEQGRLTPRTPA
ncbi:MAG: hypothetical protein AAGA68_18275 [Pseudomonadota bacterium]